MEAIITKVYFDAERTTIRVSSPFKAESAKRENLDQTSRYRGGLCLGT